MFNTTAMEWELIGNKIPNVGQLNVPSSTNWPRPRHGGVAWYINETAYLFGGRAATLSGINLK